MKETSKVSHKLASSTSRQASNAKTERGGSATSSGGGHGAATAQRDSHEAACQQEQLRFLRHCRPGSRPGPPRQALCTPGHIPLTAKLSVSSRSKGKRNSRQRASRAQASEPARGARVHTPREPVVFCTASKHPRRT